MQWKIAPHYAKSKKAPSFYEITTNDIHNLLIAKTWTGDNARLIAAAPELLKALKALVANQEETDVMEHDLDSHEASECMLCEARAAIAKAEGQG